MTKILQQLFFLLLVQNVLGQSVENYSNVNSYSKYTNSSFECEFKSNDKTILSNCNNTSQNSCANFLSSHFRDNKTYRIVMTLLEKKDSIVFEREYIFEGKFETDADGKVLLLGIHPFKSNSITIKELKQKDLIYTLRYEFKLNTDYNWTNKQKLIAYCDGLCIIQNSE